MFRTTVKLENWRDKFTLLKIANEQFREEFPIMTQLEAKRTRESIDHNRQAWYQEIYNGAVGEYFQAVQAVQAAESRIGEAKKAEGRRWSAAKLAEEMKAAEVEITGIVAMSKIAGLGEDFNPGRQITQVYQQAMEGGDLHKQRGTLEIIRAAAAGLVASGQFAGEEKQSLNRIAKQVSRDLDALRVTPEMQAAAEGARAAVEAFGYKREELREIGELMDHANPEDVFSTGVYSKALRKVRFDQSGHIAVLADDDPELTGVTIRGEK